MTSKTQTSPVSSVPKNQSAANSKKRITRARRLGRQADLSDGEIRKMKWSAEIIERAKMLTDGQALLEFLDEQSTRERLFQAAEDGKPAFSSIYDDLLAKFGQHVVRFVVWTFIEEAVHEIMIDAGFERRTKEGCFDQKGISRPSAIYIKDGECANILSAMISALDETQLLRVIKLAEAALSKRSGSARHDRRSKIIMPELVGFVQDPSVRNLLFESARDGESAVSYIYEDLIDQFGPIDWDDRLMMSVTWVVESFMHKEGYARHPGTSSPSWADNVYVKAKEK
jgi:hypothetical protein